MVENRQCSEDEEKYYILIKSFIVQIIFHAIFSMDDNQKMFLKQREERNKGQYTEKRIHLSSRLPYWLSRREFCTSLKSHGTFFLTP